MECERCNSEFPSVQLHVDIKGKRLVCDECHVYLKSGKLVPERVKEEAKKSYSEVRKKLGLSTVERLEKMGKKKEKYNCKECGYEFHSIQNFKGKCPYCGEDGVRVYTEEIPVKEIDNFIFL